MTDYSHTFELPEVNEACGQLISENAELLIGFIYQNVDRAPYDSETVRVGLVLKTLLRPGDDNVRVNAKVIEPVLVDLKTLINGANDSLEKKIYTDELRFLQGCTLLDDLISLNTVVRN